MSAFIIVIILLLLVGAGVGIYFLVGEKKACSEYDTQDNCKSPCKWDTYGGKCIGEKDAMTPAPPQQPAPDASQSAKETVEETSGFSAIDKAKGHPKSTGVSSHIPFPRGVWRMVRAGGADNAEVCYEYAKNNNLTNWGWRKGDKSCWSYMDPTLFVPGMQPGTQANHVSGCTEPGMKMADGCRDMQNGDVVWGYTSGWTNIDGNTKMTFEECRERAKEQEYEAFGYRTNLHPNNSWTATCGGYTSEIPADFIGKGNDQAHLTACVDPTKKVRNQCLS